MTTTERAVDRMTAELDDLRECVAEYERMGRAVKEACDVLAQMLDRGSDTYERGELKALAKKLFGAISYDPDPRDPVEDACSPNRARAG